MDEYINREAAIKVLCNCKPHTCSIDDCEKGCQEVRAICAIPAADVVERKHGEWVLYNKGFGFTHYCSNCNFEVREQWIDFYNYCPNCGARMEGN